MRLGSLRASLLFGVAAAASLSASAAQAQTVERSAADEEIVVTASRVQRSGFSAPTPTTVVGAEEIERSAVINPADLLNRYIPSFAPTATPSTNQFSTLRPGGNIANLRNLNIGTIGTRTLVLVDGRRHVATNPAGSIDMDVIPSGLIDRIDVVTGGASAAWGSDAVAGVVNLIFKDDFEGLDLGVQYGISAAGDNEQARLNVAYGTELLNGRAHFMIGADFVDRQGILNQGDRDWGRRDRQFITTAGNPSRVLVEGVNRVVTTGGLITAVTGGPAPAGFVGTTFGPGGATGTPFTFGPLLGTGVTLTTATATQQGGSGIATQRDLSLAVPSERSNVFARATFDLTPNITAYGEASYAISRFRDVIATSGDGASAVTTRLHTIGQDYAFLPTAIRNQMVTSGITSFRLARFDVDMPLLTIENENTTYRTVLGLEGEFAALGGDWRWDAYWQRGDNEFYNGQLNNRITGNTTAALAPSDDRWGQAIDAILVAGVPVCRSVTARAAGCQPLNLIGTGPQSDAALDYFVIDTWSRMQMVENAFAASINGEPFSTWAGPVSVAAGLEHRKNEYSTSADPYTTRVINAVNTFMQTTGLAPTSAQTSAGLMVGSTPFNVSQPGHRFQTAESDVTEAFFETVVPLAMDLPLLELFEFNGAMRWTDYSQSGEVETWKYGFNWMPISDLRVRAAVSRDIRAPSINDLFSLGVGSTPTVSDPFLTPPASYTISQRSGGNPLLVPEIGDTLTVGVVLEPSFLTGFRASIDYYDIEIAQAIGALTSQQIIDRCLAGDSLSCGLITRDPGTGRITQIIAGSTNSQDLKTSGVDFEVVYTMPLSNWIAGSGAHLSFRVLGNHTNEFINAAGLDFAGSLGTGQQGVPEWRGTATALYENGPLDLSMAVRYIGSGTWNATLPAATMAPFEIDAQTLVDATIQYNVVQTDDRRVQLYFNVQNLFDEEPPVNPSTTFTTIHANTIFHDVVGRMFNLGLRFNY